MFDDEPTPYPERETIDEAIARLEAGGVRAEAFAGAKQQIAHLKLERDVAVSENNHLKSAARVYEYAIWVEAAVIVTMAVALAGAVSQ